MTLGWYKCKKCGEMHKHEQYVLGSPVDYDCKKDKHRYHGENENGKKIKECEKNV